jgi:hypothetical protein
LERIAATAFFNVYVGLLLCIGAVTGCGTSHPATFPVSGKVTYNDQPLEFGTVLFQPEVGPPAVGRIQPDGTFRLSTYGTNDGAVPGKHKVQIMCFENQSPKAKAAADKNIEPQAGQSLIPSHYSNYDTSGLTADVSAVKTSFDFNLHDLDTSN